MPGIAGDVEAALASTLFAHVEAHRAGQVATAGLGEAVLPREGIGVVFCHPPHAQATAGLFIGHAHEGKRSAGVAGARYLAGDGCHGGGNKEHVYGTAAVELAVFNECLEGRLSPLGFVDGDDIGMPHKGEGLLGGIAGDGHHDGHASRVGFKALDGDVFTGKKVL